MHIHSSPSEPNTPRRGSAPVIDALYTAYETCPFDCDTFNILERRTAAELAAQQCCPECGMDLERVTLRAVLVLT